MQVLKFGGTSVGSSTRMREVAEIVTSSDTRKIIVLSAVSGTTNQLSKISEYITLGKIDNALQNCKNLRHSYDAFIEDLFSSNQSKKNAQEFIKNRFNKLEGIISQSPNDKTGRLILAEGELMSTNLFAEYLKELNLSSRLINALDFMVLDENQEPDLIQIKEKLTSILAPIDEQLIITQGYICRNHKGGVDNLQRGGSDYTATLIGAAINASEVQIWTDIDGVHNNDPRVVENTMPIAELSFEEAGELAYFGAKILHPSCIFPAQQKKIPVRIKNTLAPQAAGTLISTEKKSEEIKAIAVKDGITAIKIKSTRMINAYGFLKKIFEVFEKYQTPIDMITTSEIAVSLTIDKPTHLSKIIHDLKPFGFIEVDKEQSIICIVGNFIAQKKGIVKKVFSCLDNIPVRMISYGGSKNNISILIDTNYKTESLKSLNKGLFNL